MSGSTHSRFQSFGVSQKPSNVFREMEVEFNQTPSGLRTYLNVLSMEFSSSTIDPGKTEVFIKTGSIEQRYLADKLAGNQRVLLPEEAQTFILNQLLLNHPVTIISGRFEAAIQPDEFASYLPRLQHSPKQRH